MTQKQRQEGKHPMWLMHNPQQTSQLAPRTLVRYEAGCLSGEWQKDHR